MQIEQKSKLDNFEILLPPEKNIPKNNTAQGNEIKKQNSQRQNNNNH